MAGALSALWARSGRALGEALREFGSPAEAASFAPYVRTSFGLVEAANGRTANLNPGGAKRPMFARVSTPEVLASGHDRRFAAGVAAASGTLALPTPLRRSS